MTRRDHWNQTKEHLTAQQEILKGIMVAAQTQQVKDLEVRCAADIKDMQAEQDNHKTDPGKFTNEEAYCPSTPAKTKSILDIASNVSSPIFHNKSRVALQ